MAILAFLSFIKIFFNLNSFIEIADINEFRVLQIQIKKNVTPLYSSEWSRLRGLICQNHVRLSVFAVLEIPSEHIMLFYRHLFEANRAHVMIEAVVDVRFVRVCEARLQRLPGCLRSKLLRQILWSFRFVKDAGLSFDSEVAAQLVEPSGDRAVSWKRAEANLLKRLFKAKNRQCLLLR